jgi:hypothetical protein
MRSSPLLLVAGTSLFWALACGANLGNKDGSVTDTGPTGGGDTDTDSDADADSDTDADTDTDTDADTDADTDTDTTGDVDADGDGWTVADGDCDDSRARVNPDSPESCTNGVDDDCDGDADSRDSECASTGVDTGLGAVAWTGEITTSRGTFSSSDVGLGLYGVSAQDWVCTMTGPQSYEGAGHSGCPDCEWAFDLSAVSGSVASGTNCDGPDFAWTNGGYDGYFDYDFGFAYSYTYDYNGTPLYFEDNVLLYISGYDWFVFAFNLPSYGIYETYGDASDVSWARFITNSSGSGYYYYYYYL